MNLNHKFNGYEPPIDDFERARTQLATPFLYIDIALDSAGVDQIINIAGSYLYVDTASTGVATVELNNQYSDKEAPFTINPGFALHAVFKQLRMNWAAQPGKFIRILYSTDSKVTPSNTGVVISSISNGNSNPAGIYDAGFSYGASYKSITGLAANTPDTVFTPAANVNGAIVWAASLIAMNPGTGAIYAETLVAKSSAPTTVIDGDVIDSADFSYISANYFCRLELTRPVRIPAGKGLYFIATVADSGAVVRSALYTLL